MSQDSSLKLTVQDIFNKMEYGPVPVGKTLAEVRSFHLSSEMLCNLFNCKVANDTRIPTHGLSVSFFRLG